MINKQLVLVADKDPHACRLMTDYLAEKGYQVVAVGDGQSALDQVARLRPVLAIVAILLPKMDGLAVCRNIKSNQKLSPTVVLVCSILAAKARAHDAGADGFLNKPLSKDRFFSAVVSLLEKASRPSGESNAR